MRHQDHQDHRDHHRDPHDEENREHDPFLPKHPHHSSEKLSASGPSRSRILIFAVVFAALSLCAVTFLPASFTRNYIAVSFTNATLTPIELADGKWTVSPPSSPLTGAAMAATCQAFHSHSHDRHSGHAPAHHPYYWVDPDFVDPAADSCKTMTYVLGPTPQGLAETLLEVYTALTLAQRENRTFYLDDTSWPWGRWSDYFLPLDRGPHSCPRPAYSSQLPCPRSAQHLTVAHETRAFVFGHSFVDHFENPRKMGVERQREIFAMVEDGMSMFPLIPEVMWRQRDLPPSTTVIHVRKGAVKPRAWKWRKMGAIPLSEYVRLKSESNVVVLTDDEQVYGDPALTGTGALPAVLGNEKGTLLQGGWTTEGLMNMRRRDRVQLGRRYMGELLVASRADQIVCAYVSATCRLLAVAMGWDRAVVDGKWVDVDEGRDWKGINW